MIEFPEAQIVLMAVLIVVGLRGLWLTRARR